MILCLIAAAITTTVIANNKLSENEHKLFQSQFDSTAQNALNIMVASFQRMNLGIQEMASIYSHNFPNQEDWPTVAWTGFQPTAKLMGEVAAIPTIVILPIVYPHQVAKYEPFIAKYYNGTDPYIDEETFLFPDFPPGTIYYEDYNSGPESVYYIDHYGNLTGNRWQLMVPISQYTLSLLGRPYLVGYNLYCDPYYTDTIDAVMDCVESTNTVADKTTQCGTLARPLAVHIVTQSNPTAVPLDVAAAIAQPIFPANNPTNLVGFVGGSISWMELFTNIIPASVGSLYCVIATDLESSTFIIEQGQPRYYGYGDLHDSKLVNTVCPPRCSIPV